MIVCEIAGWLASMVMGRNASMGIVLNKRGVVTVVDPECLQDVAQFNGAYLHLDRAHDRTAVGQRAGDLV